MKLFISHDHDDIAKVEELAIYLKHAGHDAWYDHELLPGQRWQTELKTQVESCDVFVYVISRDSLKSDWCKREYRIAKKAKIPIIPVLIDKGAISLMTAELGEIQYSDFYEGFKPDKIAKLMGGLTRIAEDLAVKKARIKQQIIKQQQNDVGLTIHSKFASSVIPLIVELQDIRTQLIKNLVEQANDFLSTQQWEKALNKLDELLKRNVKNETIYSARGKAYLNLKDYKKALDNLNIAVKINPKRAMPFFHRSNVYIENREWDKGLADLDEVLRLEPQFVPAYNSRGGIYYEIGDFDKSLDNLDTSIEIDPQYAEAYYNRVLVLFRMGKIQEALANAEKSRSLSPDDRRANNDLAFLLFQVGRYEEARDIWEIAASFSNTEAHTFAGYGVVLEELNAITIATKVYLKAIALDKRWKNDLEAIAKEYMWTDAMIELARRIIKRLGA